MNRSESITGRDRGRLAESSADRRSRLSLSLLGGGSGGNEELTSITGTILLVLLAVIGITILRIGQLIWLHLFLGLLLIGPVTLKIASTTYRFVHYYDGDPVYLAKGPPPLLLRAIGPIIVISTVVVFVSGIVLLFVGPRNRATPLLIHKVSFIVWVVFMVLHVLGHLPGLGKALRAASPGAEGSGEALSADGSAAGSGAAGRWLALAGAIVGGAVLALVLIPHFGLWTAPGALAHHHHEFH